MEKKDYQISEDAVLCVTPVLTTDDTILIAMGILKSDIKHYMYQLIRRISNVTMTKTEGSNYSQTKGKQLCNKMLSLLYVVTHLVCMEWFIYKTFTSQKHI